MSINLKNWVINYRILLYLIRFMKANRIKEPLKNKGGFYISGD